jgi:hypothetical protein
LRSSGVFTAYITTRNIIVDMSAYSISCVALKAIAMRDTNLNILLLKRVLRFLGILMALPEKRPWYKMIKVKRIG